MSGHYGADQLYYAMLFVVVALILVNMLVDSVILMGVSNAILSGVAMALIMVKKKKVSSFSVFSE